MHISGLELKKVKSNSTSEIRIKWKQLVPQQSFSALAILHRKKTLKTTTIPTPAPNTHTEEHTGLLPICIIYREKTLGAEVESTRLQNFTPCLSFIWCPYSSTHHTSINKLHKKITQVNIPVPDTSRENSTENENKPNKEKLKSPPHLCPLSLLAVRLLHTSPHYTRHQ